MNNNKNKIQKQLIRNFVKNCFATTAIYLSALFQFYSRNNKNIKNFFLHHLKFVFLYDIKGYKFVLYIVLRNKALPSDR